MYEKYLEISDNGDSPVSRERAGVFLDSLIYNFKDRLIPSFCRDSFHFEEGMIIVDRHQKRDSFKVFGIGFYGTTQENLEHLYRFLFDS